MPSAAQLPGAENVHGAFMPPLGAYAFDPVTEQRLRHEQELHEMRLFAMKQEMEALMSSARARAADEAFELERRRVPQGGLSPLEEARRPKRSKSSLPT